MFWTVFGWVWFIGILLLVWFAYAHRLFHEYTNGGFIFFVFVCLVPLLALISVIFLVRVEYGDRDIGDLFKCAIPKKISTWLSKPFIDGEK